jgi:hypothetical protein
MIYHTAPMIYYSKYIIETISDIYLFGLLEQLSIMLEQLSNVLGSCFGLSEHVFLCVGTR